MELSSPRRTGLEADIYDLIANFDLFFPRSLASSNSRSLFVPIKLSLQATVQALSRQYAANEGISYWNYPLG